MKTTGFDKLSPGLFYLLIWSYDNQIPGLEPVLKELSANFEKQYPNVKIDMVFKDFNSLVNVVPRALQSGAPAGTSPRETRATRPTPSS